MDAKTRLADLALEHDPSHPAAAPWAPAPGKRSMTQGLAPRPIIYRVESVAAAHAHAFGPRDDNGVAAGAGAAVDRAAASTGEPLRPDLRARFEGSLGADLSAVRIHRSSDSAIANQAVGAQAYTAGQDIHFGAGKYQPDDPFGMHLLAHEVAHTVQQSGGPQHRQHKLEVSGPQDAAEVEADRAADAMVRGAPAQIGGGGGPSVSRALDTDGAAHAGQQAAAGANASDIVLKVSNAQDVSEVSSMITTLQGYQGTLEKGASMISPHQREGGEVIEDIIAMRENKMRTQVPLEAIPHNAAVISQMQAYVTEAGGQTMATNQFQDQYRALQGNFGRLEGIAASFGLASFKDMEAGDAQEAVVAAVGSGGHRPDELAKTFEQLMQHAEVSGARANVETSTQALEAMPARVSDDMSTAISAIQAFRANVLSATSAEKGANSLSLRNALQSAKAKGAEAVNLADGAKELVMTGGTDAVKTVASGLLGAGAMSLSKWGALAATGAASGGTAVAWALADKLVIGPAKDMIGRAMANADAAVGIVDAKVQLEANLDAEQIKQDTATIEAFKAARTGLAKTSETAIKAVTAFVTSAMEIEVKKAAVTKSFTALSDAIKKVSAARGKGSQGKALAEMAGFLHETEQFVVQAALVVDTATKGLGVGAKQDAATQPRKAAAMLKDISSVSVWMPYPYPFRMPDGTTVEYYGAKQIAVHVTGPGFDATNAELRGEGRADGVGTHAENTHAANTVIPDVVPSVVRMRDKVLAVRDQIMAQVFNTGGK